MSETCKIVVERRAHAPSYCPVTLLLPWSYAECTAVELGDGTFNQPIQAQVTKIPEGAALT